MCMCLPKFLWRRARLLLYVVLHPKVQAESFLRLWAWRGNFPSQLWTDSTQVHTNSFMWTGNEPLLLQASKQCNNTYYLKWKSHFFKELCGRKDAFHMWHFDLPSLQHLLCVHPLMGSFAGVVVVWPHVPCSFCFPVCSPMRSPLKALN